MILEFTSCFLCLYYDSYICSFANLASYNDPHKSSGTVWAGFTMLCQLGSVWYSTDWRGTTCPSGVPCSGKWYSVRHRRWCSCKHIFTSRQLQVCISLVFKLWNKSKLKYVSVCGYNESVFVFQIPKLCKAIVTICAQAERCITSIYRRERYSRLPTT